MLMISNNALKHGVLLPQKTVVRVNVAWYTDQKSLETELQRLMHRKVCLDYPQGRTKPPIPQLTLSQAIGLLSKYTNIRYFAVSNTEDPKAVETLRQRLPSDVCLIPKIETELGCTKVRQIVSAAQTNIVMLDKEDLYTNVGMDPGRFACSCAAVRVAGATDFEVLEICGVVFST